MTPRKLTTISDVSAATIKPSYTPDNHGIGIVHLGLGAFHRAHQAVMTDAALSKAGGDWRITAVSLRNPALADALTPQNGLYTLIEQKPDGPKARIIASIANAIGANAEQTLQALCQPNIRIVTLTITEKGYGIERASGKPDIQNPMIKADLASPERPKGALGLLTAALIKRRAENLAPFTILCCDNMPDNGQFLRKGVVEFARLSDPDLAEWIDKNVAFPSSMVDRITPASTQETLKHAEALTGCIDNAAIETEPFSQWVIEDNFPQGRPKWEHGGAIFVEDVRPYEHMKLRMLNGAHSMLAYAGFLSGYEYVRDVMNDPDLVILIKNHFTSVASNLAPLPNIDFADYARDLEARFRNPNIAHKTYQIAMDGTEKLPQRIFMPACDAIDHGKDYRPFAFATAAWMRFCLAKDEQGQAYNIQDPRAEEIQRALSAVPEDAASIEKALHGLPSLLPNQLRDNQDWCAMVRSILGTMLDHGIKQAISNEAALSR